MKNIAKMFLCLLFLLFSCSDMIQDLRLPGTPNYTFDSETILHASDMKTIDEFGKSVGISGKYAIVGAWYEDGGEGDPLNSTGAAYIFERNSSGVWEEAALLHASDMQADDYFGHTVSINGNYGIVGAYQEDGGEGDPASSAGAAYIFERNSSGIWGETAILHASDMQLGDGFGYSVSISGSYAIVGAWEEDGGIGNPATAAGGAYIFERNSSGVWEEAAQLHASDMQAGDHFGGSVSITGSYAIVGAYQEDGGPGNPETGAGATYIFERNSFGVWEETALLHASDMQAIDSFGHTIALSGNYAIVGAYGEDGGESDPVTDAGSAYIFERDSNGNWSQQAILQASDMQFDDRFGMCVAIDGNYAIVDAHWEDGGIGDPVSGAGAAYIYKRNNSGVWEELNILHASDMQPYDYFGKSIAINNGKVIISAYYEDGGEGDPASEAGAVYIYE
ncbi:MAG: FG-GAP repeat protein [Spirochaetales bacterium]|nr:FG-GAP repeat protein [Spirochaetales bacterium]